MNTKRPLKFYLSIGLKGILLGLVSMGIPGLSASTIGIIVGIYYLMVEEIANIFKTPKTSIPFLVSLMIGYGLGAVGAACSISILFEYFPLITTMCIMALVFGSIPEMIFKLKNDFKKISNWIVFGVITAILIIYNYVVQEGATVEFPADPKLGYLILMFIIGIITSVTFIIPGIDFAVVFLSIGLYYPFMNLLKDLVSFGSETYIDTLLSNLKILLFYIVGYFIGIFLFSKLIKFLSKKFASQTQFASLAFVVAAIPIVLMNCLPSTNSDISKATDLTFTGFLIGGIASFFLIITVITFTFTGKDRCGRHYYACIFHPFKSIKAYKEYKQCKSYSTLRNSLLSFSKIEKVVVPAIKRNDKKTVFIVNVTDKYELNAMIFSQENPFVFVDEKLYLESNILFMKSNKIEEEKLLLDFDNIFKENNIVIFKKDDKYSCSDALINKINEMDINKIDVEVIIKKAIYKHNVYRKVTYDIIYK